MIDNFIFAILVALYGLLIYFFINKIVPSYLQVCISYVKYIKIAKKIDAEIFLLVFVTIVLALSVCFAYIIGAALWMMNSII